MVPAVVPIPCLADNYCYLIADDDGGVAYLVDPSEPGPAKAALADRGLGLAGILCTHHHFDHVGGIAALVEQATGDVVVAGHAKNQHRIPGLTLAIDAVEGELRPSGLEISGSPLLAMHVPGHTLGAIAWGLAGGDGAVTDVFTGDTLFSAGCGRLFEGSADQMYRSLQALCALPDETRLWFGHEYTAANLRFCGAVEPANTAVPDRLAALPSCTTPTTVAEERRTNAFVRAPTVADFAALRRAKDSY